MAIPYVPAFPAGPRAQALRSDVVYAATEADRTPRSRVDRILSRSFPDPTPLVSDADLLARLRGGDHAAFDAIFRQWYEPVVRSANRVLHDPGVAEELSQDVFLELWRRRETLAPDSSVAAAMAVRTR